MENNKNNAIEKTEQISNKNPQTANAKKGANVKKTKTTKNKKSKSNLDKQKKREMLAERRLEKKKLSAQRKEAKKQARLQRKQDKINANLKKAEERRKRKDEIKKLKLQKKEERLKRRQLLKHESKEQRRQRIAKEKSERLNYKRERLADKKAKRLERSEERKHKRDVKRQERRDRRNKSRGIGGWLAAVISLGCSVLILGGLLTLSYFTPLDDYMMTNTQEQKSFYDLVGYIDNLDVNLSKLVVSNDAEEQQKLLGEVRVQSNLATSSISSLALKDENKYYTTKFINQMGDFSKYLNNKLIDGGSMSSEDKTTLQSMHKINLELKNSLSDLASSIDDSFDFRSIYEGKEDNLVISRFIELESNAVDYPHMIYDGAFSDGINVGKAKALEGYETITKTQAEELFRKYFKDYNLSEVTLNGEAMGKNIECYYLTGVSNDGTALDAQISKKGGKLILFNHYKDCEKDVYDAVTCEELADKYLESIGFKNMKAVWMTEGNHLVTLNYASVVEGVICYSDLIKVNVCKERGMVSGLEASSYYFNHTKRDVPTIKLTLSEARKKVNSDIDIHTSRLAIIPKGEGKEILAYEFMGEKDGETYYVYIDANTGKEADIFKVVTTTEGTLLM